MPSKKAPSSSLTPNSFARMPPDRALPRPAGEDSSSEQDLSIDDLVLEHPPPEDDYAGGTFVRREDVGPELWAELIRGLNLSDIHGTQYVGRPGKSARSR